MCLGTLWECVKVFKGTTGVYKCLNTQHECVKMFKDTTGVCKGV